MATAARKAVGKTSTGTKGTAAAKASKGAAVVKGSSRNQAGKLVAKGKGPGVKQGRKGRA